MPRLRRTPVVVALALLLGGCGAASTDPSATGSPGAPVTATADPDAFNEADVTFLQMMVTHIGEGLELVRLVPDRARRKDVKMLAAAIEVTQVDERDAIQVWLRSWNRPLEADPHAHADHGVTPVTGRERLAALLGRSGAEFEVAFLNMLIGHHHRAVEMAQTEQRSGAHPQVRDLARRIEQSRTAQIEQMLRLVAKPVQGASWPAALRPDAPVVVD
jgi:uncharacterized protein (DUF305 family)